jgi:hypothetical protein
VWEFWNENWKISQLEKNILRKYGKVEKIVGEFQDEKIKNEVEMR